MSSIISQPFGLEDGLDFNYQYRRSIDNGQHFGKSVGSFGGTTGSTGPSVRVKLPDSTTHFGLVTCHHALSSSRDAIHASPGRALDRPVVSPSDPDHKRWVNHLKTSLDHVKDQQEPIGILAMRYKLEAGEALEPNAQQCWDYYHQRTRDIEAMKTQAETFERHLGHILCTSGLGTAQYVNGHHYTQDWGLVILVDIPLPWDDNSDGKPHWKIGRTTGQTVGGLCTTAMQSTNYDCDEGKVTVKGAACMVVSAGTRKSCRKAWSDSGNSGAGVFGPDHRIAGLAWGGDRAPDWVDTGQADKLEGLRQAVRSDRIHFFTPIEAVVAHIQARLEEDPGGKASVELLP
ncbi:hypothetical protein CSOJ01_13208 [Colletotrichum sojae]|uniref:Uncharacterized protein n=1 Tax=Colletotrichum sojae TaxID=2175907 RepID=A0A8H6ITP8_9PEZI|nr:hypothetical protein CSOJ01_13208 [Colletotrichum sojae]